MRTPATALALVALIVMACGSPPVATSPSPETRTAAGASPSAAGASPSAAGASPSAAGASPSAADPAGLPDAVANRPELPNCGTENAIRQDGPWNAAGRACFWTAYQGGQPAEFTSTRLTMEGDPITTIYRVLGDERVELFIDSTQDRWGSGAWEHAACTTLVPLMDGVVEPDFAPGESCELTPIE